MLRLGTPIRDEDINPFIIFAVLIYSEMSSISIAISLQRSQSTITEVPQISQIPSQAGDFAA